MTKPRLSPERISLLRDFASMLDIDGSGGDHIREMLDALESAYAELDHLEGYRRGMEQSELLKRLPLPESVECDLAELDRLRTENERITRALEMLGPMAEAARKATPGPWGDCPIAAREEGLTKISNEAGSEVGVCDNMSEDDWLHIAATNPAAILELERALRGGE